MIKIPILFPDIDVQTKISIGIVSSIALAILTYMSLFNLAGQVGDVIGSFLGILLGKGAGLLPIAFVFVSIVLYRLQKDQELTHDLNARLLWGIAGMIAVFNGFLNIIFNVKSIEYIDQGGGLLGYIVYPRVLGSFGEFGAIVILLCVFMGCFFLISQMTVPEFVSTIQSSIKNPGKVWDFIPDLFELFKKSPNKTSFNSHNVTEQGDKNTMYTRNEQTTAPSFSSSQSHKTTSKPSFKASHAAGGVIDFDKIDFKQSGWVPFPSSLLKDNNVSSDPGDVQKNESIIKDTLSHFGITVEMRGVRIGPTVSQYALKPANGVKLSAIDNVQRDLGLALATPHVRIEAPIHGQSLVGIEIPNTRKAEVRLGNLLRSAEFHSYQEMLPIAIGQDVAGHNIIASLAKMPHLLVAGATGSGKSVWINSMLLSLLHRYSPHELQLVLVDMKRVELKLYEGIPHLLCPVITEAEKAVNALKWTVIEMDKRYKLLEIHGKRNIKDYNAHALDFGQEQLPYIVFVIDELGDLMMLAKSEVEPIIVRLTQMSRAVGIHLVLGTQRPDTHVVTGLIKANVPSRIAFAVASQIDSRVILDQGGAEKLLGQGDGLFMNPSSIQPLRFQGPNVDEHEVRGCVDFLIKQGREFGITNCNAHVTEPPKVKIQVPGMVTKDEEEDGDIFFEEARKIVTLHQKASASFLQQMMGIGYPKAARIIQQLEDAGIIGPQNGSKPREVYAMHEDDMAEQNNI